MLKKHHVPGVNKKHKVMLYALSTCMWCARTKSLLGELGVDYEYVDVDLAPENAQAELLETINVLNPNGGFPVVVINGNAIVGFKPEEISEACK